MLFKKLLATGAAALTAAAVVVLGLSAYGTAAPAEAATQPAARAGEGPGSKAEAKVNPKDQRQSADHLKNLALAFHDYHGTNGVLPPAAVVARGGKPLLSWRVLLLPHLGEDKLFKKFKLDEPWDGAHNKKLLDQMPEMYAPVGGKAKDRRSTFIQVFTGPGTVFEGQKGVRLLDITDGTSATVLLVEAAKAVPWTKPADVVYDPKKPLPKLGGQFGGDFNMALADGSVHFVPKGFNQKVMRALITRNGGEIFDFKDLNPKK
jgi:hypothetical protein